MPHFMKFYKKLLLNYTNMILKKERREICGPFAQYISVSYSILPISPIQ